MDGPFLIHGLKINPSKVNLKFCKERLNGNDTIIAIDCSIKSLKESLFEAAKSVINEIDRRKWETTDITELRKAIDTL